MGETVPGRGTTHTGAQRADLNKTGIATWPGNKESPCNAGDARDACLIPRWGRSPGEGNGYPPQYSCLEYTMDRGTWWATQSVGVAKSQTRLTTWAHAHTHTHTHTHTHAHTHSIMGKRRGNEVKLETKARL